LIENSGEKNLHIRISQLNDLVDVLTDVIEASGIIPDFNKQKLAEIHQYRVQRIYNITGKPMLTLYNLNINKDEDNSGKN